MLDGKTIAVVVPAYNEGNLITKVLTTMPEFVDNIIVVNDGSIDDTLASIKQRMLEDPRIILVNHERNQGLGQTLIDGYLKAREAQFDVVAVMAGDAQMCPDDLITVVKPIVDGKADYSKGNRLLRAEVTEHMPKYRFIGNAILTLLTKFATGYWHVIDPQCGYTAISKQALSVIPIETMIKGYGYNAHILNMLNLTNFSVYDVEVKPVYGDEKSKIKLGRYIYNVSRLLIRLFFKRLFHKYLVRDFNPLVLFYLFSLFCTLVIALPLAIRFFVMYLHYGVVPTTTLSIFSFSSMMGFLSLFFGMWLDMEDNKKLVPDKR